MTNEKLVENEKNRVMARLHKIVSECETEAQARECIIDLSLVSIAILRGTLGDEFAKGFLTGAINDPKPFKIKVVPIDKSKLN